MAEDGSQGKPSRSKSPSPQAQTSKKKDDGSTEKKKKEGRKELLNKSSTFLDAASKEPLKDTRTNLGWEVIGKFKSEEAFSKSAIMEEIRYPFSVFFYVFAANLRL